MTENNYINFDEVEQKFEEKIREHNQKIKEREEKETEKKRKEMNQLLNVLSESIENEAKKKRDKEMEKEKSQAIKNIEDKYDKQGLVKSDNEKRLGQGYSKLLGDEDKSSEPDLLSVDKETYNHSLGFDDADKNNHSDKSYLDFLKKLESKDDDVSLF